MPILTCKPNFIPVRSNSQQYAILYSSHVLLNEIKKLCNEIYFCFIGMNLALPGTKIASNKLLKAYYCRA